MFWFFKKLLKWTQNIPQWSWVSWILSQNVTSAYLIIYLKLFHCFYFSTLWELEGSQWFSNWRVVIPGVNTEPLQRGCLWPGVKSIVKLRWVNKTDGEINKSLQMQAFVKILLGLFCIGCFSCHCERLWFLCNTGLKQLNIQWGALSCSWTLPSRGSFIYVHLNRQEDRDSCYTMSGFFHSNVKAYKHKFQG